MFLAAFRAVFQFAPFKLLEIDRSTGFGFGIAWPTLACCALCSTASENQLSLTYKLFTASPKFIALFGDDSIIKQLGLY